MKKKPAKKPSNRKKNTASGDLIAPMRDQIEENRKIYVERQEYRAAKTADYKGCDRKWYDAAEAELKRLGYSPLGDVVNETVARATGMRIVIRRLVSVDGVNAAAIFQFKNKSFGVDLRVYDLETELSDGSFLCTTNAEAAAAASMPKQIHTTHLPTDTPLAEVVNRHEESKQKRVSGKRGTTLTATIIRTGEDYDAMQHRQEAIKAAFRAGIGYIDPAEIRRIASQQDPDDPVFADIAAVSADAARGLAKLEEEKPAAAGLMGMMMSGKEPDPDELAKLLMGAVLEEHPDVSTNKQNEIAETMKNVMSAATSGDENAGMFNLFKMMGQLQELEPKEKKEAEQANFRKVIAKAKADHQRRMAERAKKRLAMGISRQAGTGKAEPEILIHGLPIADLDYEDKPRKNLTAMINEINASKSRRDAKTLARLPFGHSRIGGLPDLPPGRPWPMHKGKKIPFVAQINLAEFPKAAHPLLPERGHLYAFALISNEEKLRPPPVSVFLYEGDTASLKRAAFPSDKEIWPDWGNVRVYEILPATGKPKGRNPKVRSSKEDDTLGWLQGEMDGVFGTAGEIADERLEDGDDWINLMAFFSVGSMLWSDAGHLYLLIRRSALKKRDFSNVLAACCSS